MRSVSTFAILLAVAATSSATLVTIDDFTSLPQSLSVNTTGQVAATYASGGTMVGGSRALIIENVTSTRGRSASFEIDSGAFGSHGHGVKSVMVGVYGATGIVAPNSNSWFISGSDSISLSGLQGFEFDWLGNDAPVTVQVAIRSNGGWTESRWSKTIPAGGAQTLSLSASELLYGGADPNAINHLFFLVDSTSTAATDWGIGKFSAVVPEPASMAVLGVGLAALRRRRAKKA